MGIRNSYPVPLVYLSLLAQTPQPSLTNFNNYIWLLWGARRTPSFLSEISKKDNSRLRNTVKEHTDQGSRSPFWEVAGKQLCLAGPLPSIQGLFLNKLSQHSAKLPKGGRKMCLQTISLAPSSPPLLTLIFLPWMMLLYHFLNAYCTADPPSNVPDINLHCVAYCHERVHILTHT